VPGNIPANSLSIQSSLNLAHDTNSIIKFDEVSQSPYFTYTVNNLNQNTSHIVWSVDARSILALVELINSRNLKGPGFWNLMTYVPQLWLVMNTQYEIEKLLPVNSTT
jgi:spore germination protein